MPKTEREFERMRSESKERILNKAIEVFAKKGYAATNISDIAESAGLSVGLMYRYFRSKQDLFETIANIAVNGLIEVTRILNAGGSPKEKLEAFCTEILNDTENEDFINLNMMMVQGIISENNPQSNEILGYDKKMFEAAAALIKRGQDEGVFGSGDPEAKSTLLFSTIQGMTMMRFFFKEGFRIPSLAELTAGLYVNS